MPFSPSPSALADAFGLVTLVASPVLADDVTRRLARLRDADRGRSAAVVALLRELASREPSGVEGAERR